MAQGNRVGVAQSEQDATNAGRPRSGATKKRDKTPVKSSAYKTSKDLRRFALPCFDELHYTRGHG